MKALVYLVLTMKIGCSHPLIVAVSLAILIIKLNVNNVPILVKSAVKVQINVPNVLLEIMRMKCRTVDVRMATTKIVIKYVRNVQKNAKDVPTQTPAPNVSKERVGHSN